MGQDGPADGVEPRLERIESMLARGLDRAEGGGTELVHDVERAGRWAAGSELRWPVTIVVLVVILLQLTLPEPYRLADRWLVAGAELVLLVTINLLSPGRVEDGSRLVRYLSLSLLVVMSVANLDALVRLIHQLLTGSEHQDAAALLTTGASIWLANVVVFALWYWEFDRGGPAMRLRGDGREFPDFLFAQMTTPEVAPSTWKPVFVDYLYLSFTNATAFSPTDTLPLARWAKVLMMLQSGVSLITVALVIARAVNVLN
jgi:uncharacterized membrane protein